MLELNGKKYSKEPFDGYTNRARVNMEISEIVDHTLTKRNIDIDIYTDNNDRNDFSNIIWDRSNGNVTELIITFWTTKEYDDAAAELVEELLNKKN